MVIKKATMIDFSLKEIMLMLIKKILTSR